MNNISAIIVVKDNPPRLFDTISSVSDFVKEIVIVDIGIGDKTAKLLAGHNNLTLVKIDKAVPLIELIRNDLPKMAKFDQVLLMDPDEIFPEAVKKVIAASFNEFDYFNFPRKNIIFGKWIEHSRWWPDYQIRFFKRNKVTWPQIIHSQPQTIGRGYKFDAEEKFAITHYNYEGLDDYLSKSMRYARSEAAQYLKDNRRLTAAETVKKGLHEFISRYLADKGYLDGIRGFILAFLQMFYCFLVYFYYAEGKNFRVEEKDSDLMDHSGQFFHQGWRELLYWKNKKSLKEKILEKII